jgi:hypothetical protein
LMTDDAVIWVVRGYFAALRREPRDVEPWPEDP